MMLGAVLARGVVGASPFFSTVAAGLVMVLIHRLLSHLSIKNIWIGKIVKGKHHTLYKNGTFNRRMMSRHGISEDDVKAAIRATLHSQDIDLVKEVVIEKNGEISVIGK